MAQLTAEERTEALRDLYRSFPVGTVVFYSYPKWDTKKFTDDVIPGHVTGFTFVEYDDYLEPILLVKFADRDEVQSIHPSNVSL